MYFSYTGATHYAQKKKGIGRAYSVFWPF